ncbi:MAG TPA: hypothetical protein PKW21_03240 [Rhabdaerophilum sp.]|nr:hypothetical protein [Rhabdaerophilum sp.]
MADALKTELVLVDAGGVITLADGFRIRLAGIVWPDHLEPRQRKALAAILERAAVGQTLRWKPAAGPDRWGVTPAHLFIQEPDGGRAPFWLQAGLVENGLTPVWPEGLGKDCLDMLAAHEAIAIRARRGIWAPRAQATRHRMIEAARDAHAGRRMVALWRVRSVKPWRSMHFVNIVPSFRGGPSVGLTRKQVKALVDSGTNPAEWRGRWVVARFVLGSAGLSRIRVESISPVDAAPRRP